MTGASGISKRTERSSSTTERQLMNILKSIQKRSCDQVIHIVNCDDANIPYRLNSFVVDLIENFDLLTTELSKNYALNSC